MVKLEYIVFKTLAFLILAVLNVCPVRAQDQTAFLEQLIDRSDIHKHVNLYLEQIQLLINSSPNSDLQKSKSLSEILDQFSQSDELREKIRDKFKSSFNMNEAQELLKWLESPLALRIKDLDNEMATEKALIEMQQQKNKLYKNDQRVQMAQKIDTAIQATEASMNTVEQMGIVSGIMTTPEKSIETISSQMKAEIKQYREQYKDMSILSILYAYQDLSDEELSQYFYFTDSDVGRRYNKAVMEIVTEALEDISKLVHQEISIER